MIPTMFTVTNTKNAYFSEAQTDAYFVRMDINNVKHNLRV